MPRRYPADRERSAALPCSQLLTGPGKGGVFLGITSKKLERLRAIPPAPWARPPVQVPTRTCGTLRRRDNLSMLLS